MKSTSPIIYEQSGRIAHITLNRPDVLNAIDEALPSALEAAVIRANADESLVSSFCRVRDAPFAQAMI